MNRRKFLTGLIAAPAIVRPGILMPLRGIRLIPGWSSPLLPDFSSTIHMITPEESPLLLCSPFVMGLFRDWAKDNLTSATILWDATST